MTKSHIGVFFAMASRINLRWLVWIASLAFCVTVHAQALSAKPRPNLVVVLTDDQGHWTMSAYGNRQCKTPNMDRLAHEGALFTNAFSVTLSQSQVS